MIERTQDFTEATLTSRIAQQVLTAARRDVYRTSGRPPGERELAEQLAVSRNTVTTAYAVLEQQGVVRRIHGEGAYVCALPIALPTQ